MRIVRRVHGLVLAALVAVPLPVRAQPPASPEAAAAEAAARAQTHFAEEQWDLAVEALVEAYALDPDPAYLYARAQAERMGGRCKIAIALYERFLESGPSEAQAEDTRINIRRCEETLWAKDAAEPERNADAAAIPGPTPNPPPTEPPTEPDDGPRPWQRDPTGAILLSGAVVSLAAGATVWVFGARSRRSAPDATTEGDYESEADRGRTVTGVGIGLVAMGAALAGGAALRYGLLARRARRSEHQPQARLAPSFTRRSVGLLARVRF